MTEEEHTSIFNEWLDRYKALLFKIVRTYAVDPADQQDLFQEICIQIWLSIPSFRHESAVTTWIYRIALNTAIKWIKKERRTTRGKESLGNVEHILQESKATVSERLNWIYEQIALFDQIDKSIALMLLDGFSYKEMSDISGMTESNIGVRINRIKNNLINKSKLL